MLSPREYSHSFGGVHPAGLPGTHIHFIDPVSPNKTVWYIGYQDVLAFGHLFLTGQLDTERVVAIGGPGASNPRLVKTVLGANLTELTAGELGEGEQRIISGSVLSGRGRKMRACPILVDIMFRYRYCAKTASVSCLDV